MSAIRLLNLGMSASLQTQAIYHMLAERMRVDDRDTLILCWPDTPYLCVGYHQDLDAVLDVDECQRRGLPVVRRRLGGGATYLDRNQLFYQCVFHYTRMPLAVKEMYQCVLSAPVTVLRQLGLNAELREINEIEVDGKRIAGTGGGRIDEACVVVGNFLFDFDFETMAAVWRTPSHSFRSLAAKALRERLVTFRQLGVHISHETVASMLIEAFSKSLGRELELDSLTAEELALAKEMEQRLVSETFIRLHRGHGRSNRLKISARAFVYADEVQINGFRLWGSFLVSQEHIQDVILESKPASDWEFLRTQLRGIPFAEWKEHVLARLQPYM